MPAPAPAQQPAAAEPTELATRTPDAVADSVPRFFAPDQFAALRRLGEILMPAATNRPGATETGVAEFLDFLLRESDGGRQELYRRGLDALNQRARQQYQKPFAGISAAEAEPILAALREPWSYSGPADPFARFLTAAREDVFQATVSAREWVEAAAGRRRGASGMSYYWRSQD